MKCKAVESLLPLVAGGELGPWRAWRVRRHAGRCGECRSALAEYSSMRGMASKPLPEEAHHPDPDALWMGVAAELSRELKPRLARTTPVPWFEHLILLRAASAVAVILFALLLARSLPSPRPPASPLAESVGEKAAIPPIAVVEAVHMEGVIPVTFQTEDPKLHIIWLLPSDQEVERTEG